jgi:hypothetical protein
MERSDRLRARAGGHNSITVILMCIHHITSPQAAAQQSESALMDGTYAFRNCHIYSPPKIIVGYESLSAAVMSAVVVLRSLLILWSSNLIQIHFSADKKISTTELKTNEHKPW